VPRRASGVKMTWMAEVGTPISQDGVAVHPDCWCVCLCYLHFAPESPEDGEQRYEIWYHPMGTPHVYANRKWRNPARMQHNPVLGRRVILMMT